MQTETTGKTPRKASKMYGNKPPAARRLAQFPQQLADGGMGARMKSASTTQPQRLADGGVVSAAKRMMGLTPEDPARAARLAEYKANAEREQAAAKAASAQATAPAPQAAISQYSGMSAMQRREKEQGLADGGMIRGPGTGTSDSIATEAEPGTFIMPADSTKAIGPRVLERMGKKVPVRLSNGEYEIPPEQVMGIGAAVLELMKESTHEAAEDVDEGESGDRVAQMLASGGMVENDVTRVGNSYSGGNVGGNITVNGSPTAGTFNENPASRMGAMPTPPAAPAPMASAAPSPAPQTAAAPAAAPAAPMGWAERNAQRSNQVTASSILDSPERRAAQTALMPAPVAAPAPVAPPTAAQRFGTLPALGQPAPGEQPRRYADGGTVKDEERAVFGLYPQMTDNQRTTYATADKLRSGVVATGPNTFATALTPKPIAQTAIRGGGDGRRMNAQQDPRSLVYAGRPQIADTAAVAPAQAAAQGQAPAATVATNAPAALPSGSVSAQDDAAAGAVSRRGAADALAQMPNAPAPVTAPAVRNSTNDWAARKALENAATAASSITANGSAWDKTGRGDSPAQAAYKAALATDQALQQAQPGMDQAAMRENAGIQREGMQQQGSTARDAERNAISRDELGLRRTAAGFKNRAAQRMEDLSGVLLDPNATPEQRSVAQRNLAALSGNTEDARKNVITLGGGQEWDAQAGAMRNVPQRAIDLRTGQEIGVRAGAAGQGASPSAAPVSIGNDAAGRAAFSSLPSGATFIGPDGKTYRKS